MQQPKSKMTAFEIAAKNDLIVTIRKVHRLYGGDEDDEFREYVAEVIKNHPIDVSLKCFKEIVKQGEQLKWKRK